MNDSANTAQRVAVERFTADCEPCNDFESWRGVMRGDAHGFYVRHSDYAGLLLQVSELKTNVAEMADKVRLERERRESTESKLAAQAAEIDRAAVLAEGREATIRLMRRELEAAERGREEAKGIIAALLKRDASPHFNGECGCINHSRKAEREYEAGTCPHQLGAAFLAANGGCKDA